MHIKKLLISWAIACFCIYLAWVVTSYPYFEDILVRLVVLFFIFGFFVSFLISGFSAIIDHIFEKYNFCRDKWFNITFNLVFGSLLCLFLYFVLTDVKKSYLTPLKNEEVIKQQYAFYKEALSSPQLLEDYDHGVFKLQSFPNLDVRFSCSHPRAHIDYSQNEDLKKMFAGQKVKLKVPSYWTFRRTYCCKNKDLSNDLERFTVYKIYLDNQNITSEICHYKFATIR